MRDHTPGLALPWKLLGVHSFRMDMRTRDQVLDESLVLNSAWYADIADGIGVVTASAQPSRQAQLMPLQGDDASKHRPRSRAPSSLGVSQNDPSETFTSAVGIPQSGHSPNVRNRTATDAEASVVWVIRRIAFGVRIADRCQSDRVSRMAVRSVAASQRVSTSNRAKGRQPVSNNIWNDVFTPSAAIATIRQPRETSPISG